MRSVIHLCHWVIIPCWLHGAAAYKAVLCSLPIAVWNCEAAHFAALLFEWYKFYLKRTPLLLKSSNNVNTVIKKKSQLAFDLWWGQHSTGQVVFFWLEWCFRSFTSYSAGFAGMGARGSGTISLTPLHLSAVVISALLCSVWWCLIRAPSFSLHRFGQPILCKPRTGLAQGLSFSVGAEEDGTGSYSTKLLKGPCNFLLKDHQKEAWCFCVHDIFQYFLQAPTS